MRKLPPDEVMANLIQSGRTDNEIASAYGVGRPQVTKIRNRLGLSSNRSLGRCTYRPKLPPNEVMANLFRSGRTDNEIADTYRTSREAVSRIRRLLGLAPNRPKVSFPWRRKCPPDEVLLPHFLAGEFDVTIARKYGLSPPLVSAVRRRLGLPLSPHKPSPPRPQPKPWLSPWPRMLSYAVVVIESLCDLGPQTKEEVITHTGMSPKKVGASLATLCKIGLAHRIAHLVRVRGRLVPVFFASFQAVEIRRIQRITDEPANDGTGEAGAGLPRIGGGDCQETGGTERATV